MASYSDRVIYTLADEVRERAEWSNLHEAVAQVHDLLQLVRVEALVGMGVKRHALPEPRRLPRPFDPPEQEQDDTVSPRQLALMMGAA